MSRTVCKIMVNWTTDMEEAMNDADVVIVALPNFVHKEAILKVTRAGKAVLCTKSLAVFLNTAYPGGNTGNLNHYMKR